MTTASLPPSPDGDWKTWALSLRDYLLKERAQSGRSIPVAPQIAHKKSGESAAQDGVLIFNPVDEELEVSVGGGWKRILRNASKYLDFDQTANAAVTTGQLAWNATEGTLDLGLGGGAVSLQIGQEVVYRVKNSTGLAIPAGTVVSADGADAVSGSILIKKFIADGTIASRLLVGITSESIANGAFGYVTHFGKLSISTSAFTAGSILYPSSTVAGALTQTAPAAPGYQIPIAYALNSKAAGTISIRMQTGYKVSDLLDVVITTPASGNLFSYNGTSWVNTDPRQVFTFNDNTAYNAADAAGQINDATVVVRNTANTVDDFVQLLFSLHANDTLLARIVALRHEDTVSGALSSEMVFITEAAGVLGERLKIDRTGLPTVSGGRLKIATSSPPATATAAGTAGEIAWDASFIYVCTATNTWKRVGIATW